MNEQEYAKFSEALWEKFAHPDKHGYKDWMGRDAFLEACDALKKRVEMERKK